MPITKVEWSSTVRDSTWMSALPVHSMKCQKTLVQVTLSHLHFYRVTLETSMLPYYLINSLIKTLRDVQGASIFYYAMSDTC